MNEASYKIKLVKKLRERFPGCHIQDNDAADIQGVPDITIFWKNSWAMLEIKESSKAPKRPNQEFYVEHFNTMSFAAFIFPENEAEVLNELQRSFGSHR